jgi:hypothetical protein
MDLTCSIPASTIGETHARPKGLITWVVPDLRLIVSLLTLVWCLVFFDGTQQLFRDSDAGWHIRTGESILRGEGLPHTDPYSLLRSGQPWFAWEWGSDVLTGTAHMLGGPAFVAGLYAVAIAAATWLWFGLTWTVGGHFLIAGALAIPLLTTGNIHWHARPHVFSWLFLIGAVMYAERRKRSLLVVAIASAAWANLHASFFLGAVIALIYAVSFAVRSLIWSGFDRTDDLREARWFSAAAGASLLASLLNPYGWNLHRHLAAYLLNSELLDRVGEFQSFNFHSEGSVQILVMIAVACAGAVVALGQRRLAQALLAAMFVAMALRSARVLPVLALVALPIANGAITAALRTAGGLQPGLRRGLDAFVQYGDNLRLIDSRLSGLALVPVALALTFAILSTPAVAARSGFPPDVFPVHAADRLPANARLLAPDMYGGYLIYRFNGERKVYFDGRSDFYGAACMKDYLNLVEVRPGWRAQLDRIGFTHALLPNRYSLIPALETLGWKRIYSDTVATLLEAPRTTKD